LYVGKSQSTCDDNRRESGDDDVLSFWFVLVVHSEYDILKGKTILYIGITDHADEATLSTNGKSILYIGIVNRFSVILSK
jgi:hypothetical protein